MFAEVHNTCRVCSYAKTVFFPNWKVIRTSQQINQQFSQIFRTIIFINFHVLQGWHIGWVHNYQNDRNSKIPFCPSTENISHESSNHCNDSYQNYVSEIHCRHVSTAAQNPLYKLICLLYEQFHFASASHQREGACICLYTTTESLRYKSKSQIWFHQ